MLPRATENAAAGHMWPAGGWLPNPAVNNQQLYKVLDVFGGVAISCVLGTGVVPVNASAFPHLFHVLLWNEFEAVSKWLDFRVLSQIFLSTLHPWLGSKCCYLRKYDLDNMQRGRDVFKRSVRRQSDSGVEIMHVRKIVILRNFRTNADFYIKFFENNFWPFLILSQSFHKAVLSMWQTIQCIFKSQITDLQVVSRNINLEILTLIVTKTSHDLFEVVSCQIRSPIDNHVREQCASKKSRRSHNWFVQYLNQAESIE